MERLKQEQWKAALSRLDEAKAQARKEHEKCMEQMEQVAASAITDTSCGTLGWFKAQMDKISNTDHNLVEEQAKARQQQLEKVMDMKLLKKQQEKISRQLAALENGTPIPAPQVDDPMDMLRKALAQKGDNQPENEVLLQQLKTSLSGKKEEDPNKLLIKALLTQENKVPGEGGTNTLKPALLRRITTPGNNTMAEWLAGVNKQEEGESDPFKFPCLGEDQLLAKQGKSKSGILEKATTNIQLKQVWPQQNLGEDWADEGVEFRKMKFEHMVAGETRTIETCADQAKILGQIRLLRRIAYLKLRGYEWHLIRKMYAAILTSIETREYSWESNFDRFETILYRRTAMENCPQQQEGRKRFCRDYNKEGCPKNSPHTVWVGNGPSETKRLVYHFCAACLIRDRQQREHPEGHQDCPHRD